MDKDQQNRISRFVNDKGMAKAVEDFIMDVFTEPVQKESSVEEKAAEWLSIQKLKKAFKSLRGYQQVEETTNIVNRQVGI